MSVTVIGGVNNSRHLTGLVTVPVSNLSSGQTSNLQSVLDGLDTAVTVGAAGFTNIHTIGGSTFQASLSGGPNFLEIINTDSAGGVGTGSRAVSLGGTCNGAIVRAPGDCTVTGAKSSLPGVYLLGAQSNISLSSGVAGQSTTDTIAAADGNDTLDMHDNAVATLSGGNDLAHVSSENATINTTGNASVRAGIRPAYAGRMEFISNSSAAATFFGGAGSETVFGGSASGNRINGGTVGNNLLVAGADGTSFLVSGGNNDSLMAGYALDSASGSVSVASSVNRADYLYAGAGNETLTGSTQSGAQNVYFFGAAGADGNNIQAVTAVHYGQGGGPSALVTLSDNTDITLVGVNPQNLQSNIGSNQIT